MAFVRFRPVQGSPRLTALMLEHMVVIGQVQNVLVDLRNAPIDIDELHAELRETGILESSHFIMVGENEDVIDCCYGQYSKLHDS
ncbi:hypothetical protein G6L37_09400 [Agrobacterium rubi]|uniref:hypothetical protein n=1 Tax=Agrobacterium rubi TaxID=28099 RepID=UPI0015730EF6|nr:hypothetical protein [Agrobacterium rubi]NTF06377.1 hypothetical protein [Agrobacterium rubi]NTF18618.1 hypothetical protein [Agrobacterium rubi]NTF25582.1 hypothetical protein [Agrobacterium rubi]